MTKPGIEVEKFCEAIVALHDALPDPIVTELGEDNYDRLPMLLGILRPQLVKKGFCVSWTGWHTKCYARDHVSLTGQCDLRHDAGYVQSASFTVPDVHGMFADMEQPAHRMASAVSMIKRITLESVLGISTWAPRVDSLPKPQPVAGKARPRLQDPEQLKLLQRAWYKAQRPQPAKEEAHKRFWSWVREVIRGDADEGTICDADVRLCLEELDRVEAANDESDAVAEVAK